MDEMDTQPKLIESKIMGLRNISDLTEDEKKQVERAHQLCVTTYHMMKQVSADGRHDLVIQMKHVYLQSRQDYNNLCRRLRI